MHHRLKEIKLIVIDIDGTLVDQQGLVGEKTLMLAKELKKKGILCTLSSARSFHYSSHIADDMEIDIPFVTLDGALIKGRNGNAVYKGSIKKALITKAIALAEDNYGKITMCDEHNLFVTPRNSVVKEYTKLNAPVKEVSDFTGMNEILEILIYCEDKASMKHIKQGFGFFDRLAVSLSVTKSPNHDYYLLTIKKKQSNKLESVKKLVRHLGLQRKNVAVVGDWHNDMPLFDFGGYNIAVQNAIPELKRKADYVTNSTNNEDAVGEVLELVKTHALNGQ
ncbi:MAG: Cof-type HAD-IIB family hydrolase [Ignavibacteria bacterium]|nr:Cof-type HAD-IIB family hydrolase [Ignavibacteria bacterium]